jgi:uncharacterized protein YidB (DUF937 family)
MSIFDGVLGGLVSAGVTSLASKFIAEHGGLQGLVSQFEKGGLGSVVQSWVGTGANQPIEAKQVTQVLGSDKLQALAEKFGMSSEDLSEKLAAILPEAVDKMTPNGIIQAAA